MSLSEAVEARYKRDREIHAEALGELEEADACAATHYPGHELYAVEGYLRCLAVLALAKFRSENDIPDPGPHESKGDG